MKYTIRIFILAICAVLIGTKALWAEEFAYNGLWYETINKRQVRVVADPTDSVYRLLTEVAVPAKVSYNGRNYQVTEIDDYAFRYCHLIRTLELPEGLRKIGYQSMMNCTQLAMIRLPQSLRKVDEMAFYGCASLQTVYVGKRIKQWPEMCFSDCTALRTIYHSNKRAPRAKAMTFFNCSDSITYYRAH